MPTAASAMMAFAAAAICDGVASGIDAPESLQVVVDRSSPSSTEPWRKGDAGQIPRS
jgi:hypothetical protein